MREFRPLAAALLAAAAIAAAFPATAQDNRLARGKYLASIMDCGGCHTPGVFMGKPDMTRPLGGESVGFEIPGLGIFYPPNLTPDRETGLGKWTEADIIKAVRTGVRPDGRELAPIMPWRAYAALTDNDARALAAYLKSLKPVANAAPAMVGAGQPAKAPYFSVIVPK
ncbi:mono/diheme cytochrome c family protein [Stella humosa]|uniref:Mono/diheme cytochrome c family protein n=1 Tax=Stella humosa TaxID=94 RepID=A0A3N1KZV1_9PROT|nr:c-type cytochrome [Stella humosa]ROP83858.1 mono/diheme cytochrome c family protein [Stella humosa]BBK32880.1 cytochrome c [Stella humosa]